MLQLSGDLDIWHWYKCVMATFNVAECNVLPIEYVPLPPNAVPTSWELVQAALQPENSLLCPNKLSSVTQVTNPHTCYKLKSCNLKFLPKAIFYYSQVPEFKFASETLSILLFSLNCFAISYPLYWLLLTTFFSYKALETDFSFRLKLKKNVEKFLQKHFNSLWT